MQKKKLIINADDFGQSPGINKGIIYAHENGIVTSASLMVRYPAALEAVSYSKKNPGLGVGLHIDLGEWTYNGGKWKAVYEVVSLDDPQTVKEEISRQLEIFYRITGKKPTHIDSHQHVHLRENIRPVFVEIAMELDVTLRRCSEQVKYCGDFYGQLTDGSPYHNAIGVEGLKQIITRLAQGYTEMACHPALDNNVETMYRIERDMEVETLCDSSIRELIADNNIELCSFEGIPFHSKSKVIL